MQLGVKKTSEEKLTHYLERYRKTASLMAKSCKASSNQNVPDFFERHEFSEKGNVKLARDLTLDS